MRGVLYLRKSRADDPGETVEATLARHEAALWELATREGITVVATYREVASGDRLAGRQEMGRLLADTESGDFKAILCMDIDRLGRGSMAEQGYILDTFKQAGLLLITPRKTYNLNDDLDETYTEFESFIARQELKAIKRRLQRGIKRSVEEGSFVSAPPYGYRRTILNGHPSLIPHPVEAEAVTLAFRWYVEEGLGCQQIAYRLTAAGYLPRRAAAFSRTTVLAMLANPAYAGRVARQGQEVAGLHPPLVSPETFTAAEVIRRGRSHPPATPRPLQNPLAGLVLCGRCGRKMQRLAAGPHRPEDTLRCPRPGCSSGVSLPRLCALVRQTVLSRLPSCVIPSPAPTTDLYPRRRDQAAQQQKRLYTLLEQGVYTPEEFRARQTALAREQAVLTPPKHPPKVPVAIEVAAAYDTASPAEQNALLKDLFLYVICEQNPHIPGAIRLSLLWK